MIITQRSNDNGFMSTQYMILACTIFTISDLAFKYNINSRALFSKKLLHEQLQKNSNGPDLQIISVGLEEILRYLNFINFITADETILYSCPKQQIKQYLRKFKFYYKLFCLNTYPNNLSILSNKNLNKLALKSLLIFSGL